jgi:hypothetical protein
VGLISKISQYPTISSPPTSMIMLGTDPTDHTEAASGTTKTTTIAQLVAAAGGGGGGGGVAGYKNLISDYGADPTGGVSVATPLANACAAAVTAYPAPFGLIVPPGNYLVTAPQILPKNLIFAGSGATGGTPTGDIFNGSTFVVSSSFSGAYVFGIGDVPSSTGVNGPILRDFAIAGHAYTATAVDGISITGPAFTVMRHINIIQMSGGGINTHVDSTASPIGADGMDWDDLTIDSCGGVGIRLVFAEDGQFRNIYVIGCASDGWQIAACDNTHFTDCRAEWNSGYGLHITNITDGGVSYSWTYADGYCRFDGFSTDANYQSGIRVDATWTTGQGAGTGPGIIMFTNPSCRRDGRQNSGAVGSWAHIDVDYSAAASGTVGLPVYINGLTCTTGIGDGGTGNIAPRYGVRAASLGVAPFKIAGVGLVNGFTAPTITSGTVTNYAFASTLDTFTGANYNYLG